MEEDTKTVNTAEPAVVQDVDYEAQAIALRARESKLIEERDNWKTAALKFKGKVKSEDDEGDDSEDKMRAIAQQALAESQLAEVARELAEINAKALKENKELKLAMLNKPKAPPAAMGTHSETTVVADTLVTTEQIAYFKSQGKDDKWIEQYKKNLQRKI